MIKKDVMKRYGKIVSLGLKIHNFFAFANKLHLPKGNHLQCGAVLLKNVKLKVNGTNNTIVIKDFSKLFGCTIYINGSNNEIMIGENCSLRNTSFYIEDNGNRIHLGNRTTIQGLTNLDAIEGTSIVIGEDCMLSSDVHFRTGDSHSIVNLKGERMNPSRSITIGNHVWVGTRVVLLKGVTIADCCIVGAASTVSKSCLEPNTVLAGSPARVVKQGVDWKRERI